MKFFDVDKGKADTAFLDCSDLSEHSNDASPNADAIVTCLTKKMQELAMEIGNLEAFVSDGASVMTGAEGGVAAKIKKDFLSKMINIHCICHRLAPACADTGDDYIFINSFEENLIKLWKFFKNSSKRLKIYVRIALKCKEFDTMSNKRQKNIVKGVKKACRTRWLGLHAGADAVYDEYEGIVKTLQEIPFDRFSGSLAIGLLKKIKRS